MILSSNFIFITEIADIAAIHGLKVDTAVAL